MNKLSSTLLIIGILLMPSVQAWHLSPLPNPGENHIDIRNRVLATQTRNLDNAPAGELLNYTFPWDPEYSFQDVGHTIRIHLSYTVQHPSTSNGAWNITVGKENTGPLNSCVIRYETIDPIGISLDAVPLMQHYAWDCVFTQSTNPHYHNHTVYVNRTLASGTPAAPTAETIAVRLETEDIIIDNRLRDHREQSLEVFGVDEIFLIILLVFVFIAEWKKDAIYHLLAALLGGLQLAAGQEVAGVPRLIVVALTAYQVWRLLKVVGNARNDVQGNEGNKEN